MPRHSAGFSRWTSWPAPGTVPAQRPRAGPPSPAPPRRPSSARRGGSGSDTGSSSTPPSGLTRPPAQREAACPHRTAATGHLPVSPARRPTRAHVGSRRRRSGWRLPVRERDGPGLEPRFDLGRRGRVGGRGRFRDDEARDPLRVRCCRKEGDHPAERLPHEARPLQPELVEPRHDVPDEGPGRNRRRDSRTGSVAPLVERDDAVTLAKPRSGVRPFPSIPGQSVEENGGRPAAAEIQGAQRHVPMFESQLDHGRSRRPRLPRRRARRGARRGRTVTPRGAANRRDPRLARAP